MSQVDEVTIKSYEAKMVDIFKLQEMLKSFIVLPEGIELYLVEGQWLFPIRGEKVGEADSLIYYLIKRNPNGTGWLKQGVVLADLFKAQAENFLKA